MKAYRQYKGTRSAYDRNADAMTTGRDSMMDAFKQIDSFLTKKAPAFFRVHVAGDFTSQEYFSMWMATAAAHPGTKFLAFTKSYSMIDESIIPDNFSLVFSCWPGLEAPTTDRRKAWMQDGTDERVPGDAITCPGHCDGCGMCWSIDSVGHDVVFNKH
jgi:hypothetical protein